MNNYKKFRSSRSCGGVYFRGKKLPPPRKPAAENIQEEIVRRIRDRAEKLEKKSSENHFFNGSSLSDKIAKELRDCASSIKLNCWDDMDEI